MSDGSIPGYYGKLPTLGDFVSRRLAREVVDSWDGWLQSAIAASREELGADWLDIYLTSPLWRFALGPGVCGPAAWAGVLTPSVDRVGRNFPFAILAAMPAAADCLALPESAAGWFEGLEGVILELLDEDRFDAGDLDSRLEALGPLPPVASVPARPPPGVPWRLPMPAGGSPGRDFAEGMARALVAVAYAPPSLWWTSGSEQVEPSMLLCAGLPPAEGFAAMLCGEWSTPTWYDAGAAAGASAVERPEAPG